MKNVDDRKVGLWKSLGVLVEMIEKWKDKE